MRVRTAVLASLLALVTVPAGAQPRWADEPAYFDGLPARAIMRSVRAHGFTPVGRVLRRNHVYSVEAVDRAGQPRRVLVDASTGRVVRVLHGRADAPIERPRAGRPGPDEGPAAMRSMRGPAGGPPPEAGEDEEDRLPPPAARGRAPGQDFRATVPPDGPPSAGEQRRSLPPLRPRTAQPTEQPPQMDGAPPKVERRTARPTAKPAAPAQAEKPAAPAAAESTGTVAAPQADPATAAPAKPKGLPRVILPGGPLPKAQRAASAAKDQAPAAAPAAKEQPSAAAAPQAPSSALPPVQPPN